MALPIRKFVALFEDRPSPLAKPAIDTTPLVVAPFALALIVRVVPLMEFILCRCVALGEAIVIFTESPAVLFAVTIAFEVT